VIRVLVVDDSAFMRRLLVKLLEPYEDIEVVDTAMDGVFALDKIERLTDAKPHVITLDLEMPRLSGMDTLKRIVDRFRLPVILVSAHTSKGAKVTFDGLAAGAVDFITKPERIFSSPVASLGDDLVAKIRAAAKAKVRGPLPRTLRPPAPRMQASLTTPARDVVGIAVSTGGPNALSTLLAEIHRGFRPALLIVQHMPAGFTAQFAERLAKLASIEVREAADGDPVVSGLALVAPGGSHMILERSAGKLVVRITRADPVRGHRPSADVLFRSIADVSGSRSVGLVLTGMGEDGADGITAIRAVGGHTVAQDEASSVVYGMPRAAIERGAIDRVLPLSEIAGYLNAMSSRSERLDQQRGSPWIA